MTIAIAAIGTQLKRGDGGATAAVQAGKTVSSSNQMIRVEALPAGAAGNSKTFAIVIAGTGTTYSQVITANSVVINGATDGGGVSTTTVDHAIAQLYQDTTFVANFEASTTGNGTGVLVASAASALTGGSDSAEIFTLVPGVIDLSGPNRSQELIDVTSHDSANRYREFIVSLKDGGQMTGELNYAPSNAQHDGMNSDYEDGILRRWVTVFPDTTEFEFDAYVESFEVTSAIDQQLKASFTLKITGPVTVTLP
jgi:predicted secreted protein